MKEFIEKLIERLEEYRNFEDHDNLDRQCIDGTIEIVNQLAEEYNNGWIPSSKRLPDTEHISGVSESVLVTTNNNSIFTAEYHRNGEWLDDVADWSLEVIAWQPLPAPYQPKGD